MKKRVLIYTLSSIVILALAYTASWFIIANQIKSKTAQHIATLTKQPNFKDITYKLETSCFPSLCVELKDVNIKTKKYFAMSKNGHEISLFNEHSFKYKTNNIFSADFNYAQNAARFDITTKNLDNQHEVTFYLDANNLLLKKVKDQFKVFAKGLLIQAKTDNAALKAIADISQLNFTFGEKIEKDLASFAVSYSVFDAKLFDRKTDKVKFKIDHSENTVFLYNINKQIISKTSTAGKTDKEFAIKTVEDFVKNQTKITMTKLRHTDQDMQAMGRAEIYIDKEFFLVANADLAISFTKPNSMLERTLKHYRIAKNKEGSYIINIRTDKNTITINKGIVIPAPNFRP